MVFINIFYIKCKSLGLFPFGLTWLLFPKYQTMFPLTHIPILVLILADQLHIFFLLLWFFFCLIFFVLLLLKGWKRICEKKNNANHPTVEWLNIFVWWFFSMQNIYNFFSVCPSRRLFFSRTLCSNYDDFYAFCHWKLLAKWMHG